MVLNILALLFVLGIIFVHSMFGLYSGIINLFCSVVALAVALGYFEVLNELVTSQLGQYPSYTEPICLALLFVITLLILRVVADRFIRRNVRVPAYLDWAGGAACGFVVAQICVGVMALSFLMLPWGGQVLMFARYQRDPENRTYRDALDISPERRKQDDRVAFVRSDLWLRSDAFAVGLFNLLSRGSLRADTAFADVYPDFPEWIFWSGNTIQPESLTAPIRDEKGDGFKNGLSVETWWEQTAPLPAEVLRYRKQKPSRETKSPPYAPFEYKLSDGQHPGRPKSKLLGVRLLLNKNSADRDKQSTYHRFRPSMIRLVGDVVLPDGSRQPRQYIPDILGGVDPNIGDNLRVVDLDNNLGVPAGGQTPVDAYFEVDEQFTPRFVEYRRHARAPLTAGKRAAEPPAERLLASGSGGPGADKASGPARFIDAVNRQASGQRDRLPFVMRLDKLRTSLDVELEGQLFASGRLAGDRGSFEAPENEANKHVSRFKVPEDQRMFQLQTKPRKAKSLPGQAMNFVGSVTNQYYVYDSSGERYPLVGYYAIVNKGGRDYVELVYLPDDPSFRQMLDFRDGSVRNELQEQENAVLGLIFLVPPGREIVAVESAGGRIDFGVTFPIGK